jgi:hypothetical protein
MSVSLLENKELFKLLRSLPPDHRVELGEVIAEAVIRDYLKTQKQGDHPLFSDAKGGENV